MRTSIRFAVASGLLAASVGAQELPAELVVTNAKVLTVDARRPRASAFAVRGGRFVAVGEEADVAPFRGESTRAIDARGLTVIPGLNDSHSHVVRAGRFYNLELRWDGVPTLEEGLARIREQAARTPKGQWVRVVGGWSPYQFRERRMPTVAELNEAAPDTPTFVLFLYSLGFVNRAGIEALGIGPETVPPEGGRYEWVDGGAILHAEPNPQILYQTIAALPELSPEDQVDSTRRFYRELNRFGLTSAIDAGGGGHRFPDQYAGTQALAREGGLPIRVSYYLFPQTPGREADDFRRWTADHVAGRSASDRLGHGFELEGGGEFLTWSAGDFENFLAPRPELSDRRDVDWSAELREVVTILVDNQWPLRVHATYGETIDHLLDVFEAVRRERGRFVPRWAIDHAETATDAQLRRIAALGGGIAIQNRMAFAGEFFVERYGREAVRRAPPLRRMLEMGIPVGAGTDATRVSSYNPWLCLEWLVTGRTVGGTSLFDESNRLTRDEALRLFTLGSAWFSQEEDTKGRIAPGMDADFAVLTEDYATVPEDRIGDIESVLTVVAGEVVHADHPFGDLAPPALPAPSPEWSPVARFGGWPEGETAGE